MTGAIASRLECRSVLVLGGARSGKSRYALTLAESAPRERLYIATGAAGDAEMAARIAAHRMERGEDWATLEEPLELGPALDAHAHADRVLLVDCLTLWLANAMFAERDLAAEIERLCKSITGLRGPAVFVSNEVGTGVVPATPSGRLFRDWQGRLNQQAAQACDCAVFVTAGLPTLLKPAPAPKIELR